jgi:oxygen-independent coproporphyrinogen-3 oxidase
MSAASVGALLDRIAALWPVEAACEVTLEANPSSVEAARFAGYRAAGVNRVSLGVQSFSDEQLRFLGRLHSADEAREALNIAARHFERMSFDLIYARPGQSEAEWRQELAEALGFARGHVSLYQLTIEPQTAFFDLERRGRLRIPEADLAAGLYELTQEICEAAGLPAYEISNHAAPGQESRHNLTYWRYGDYLGIGPGAHGRVRVGAKKLATAAIRAPQDWYRRVMEHGSGSAEHCELSRREQAEEMILMGLRLRDGLSLDHVASATGFTVGSGDLQRLALDGLLEPCATNQVRATKQGQLVLNAIVTKLAEGLTEVAPDGG